MSNPLLSALGLLRHPFPPTPDADSYFYTPQLEADLAELRHCVLARKGFMLVTGEVGLGKSTLVRRLLASLEPPAAEPRPAGADRADTAEPLRSTPRVRSALVFNTFLQGEALLEAIATDFGLPAGLGMAAGLQQLNRFLIDAHQHGDIALLIIDDAQNLNPASLELVRLLSNLETAQDKLLQILLVGQPELDHALAEPSLRQLRSRIVQHTRLRGLLPGEVGRYVDFRVNAAGAAGRITLDAAAAAALHAHTGGNLRRLHLVLDRCLYGLVSRGTRHIDAALVQRAAADIPSLSPAAAAEDPVLGPAPAAAATPEPRGHTAAPASAASRTLRRPRWPAWLLGAGLGLASVAAWGAWQWWQTQSPTGQAKVSAGFTTSSPSAVTPPTPAGSGAAPAAAAPATPTAEPPPRSSPPAAHTAAPPSPAPAEDSTADSKADPAQACLAQLQGAPAEGARLAQRELSDAERDRLRATEALCLTQDQGRPLAVWWDDGAAQRLLQAERTVRQLQQRLRAQGWAELPVDGLLGPQTRAALAQFQRRHGLSPTGQPDEWTLVLLENTHAPAR